MKKTLQLVVLLSSCFYVSAQSITSLTLMPASPAPGNDIKLLAVTSYPGGPCSMFSSYPNSQSGNTITVKPIYCFESGSGGCSTTDTIDIGQLSAGNYTISFELLSNTNPGPCGSELFMLKAIQQVQFTVGGPTGIDDERSELISVFPNPANDIASLRIPGKLSGGDIQIYNASGVLVKSLAAESESKVDLTGWNEGIYFYTIRKDDAAVSGKLMIAH